MRVRVFISFSSIALFAWLTATFVRVVPMHTYDSPLATVKASEREVSDMVVAEREPGERLRPH